MTDTPLARPAPPLSRRLLWPALACVLVLSWASGFLGTRVAAAHAPPVVVLFWRTLVAGLILLPFALRAGRIGPRAAAQQMLFGALGMFLYLWSFAQALAQGVPTGLVALIADLVPLGIAALSLPMLGVGLTPRQWLGMGIGTAGVTLLSWQGLALGHAPASAYVLAILGMGVFAFQTVLQKRLGALHLPIAQSLCLQCLTAAGLFALTAASTGTTLAPPPGPDFALAIGWLVLVATFVCYSAYYAALRLFPPAQVAAVVYLSPPVTLLIAAVWLDEPLSLLMGLGMAVTVLGVWLAAPRAA